MFETLGPLPFLCFIFWRAAKFSWQIFAAQSKESRAQSPTLMQCNPDGIWSDTRMGGCSVGHGDGYIFGVPQPFNCPSSQVSKTLWPSGPEWEIKREIKYQMKCWQLGNFHRTALHCVQLDGSRAISNQIVQFTYLFECNVCYWNA